MLEHTFNDAKWHSWECTISNNGIILFCQMAFGFGHQRFLPPQKSAEPDITWFTKPVFTSSHYSISEQKWHDLICRTNMQTHFTCSPMCRMRFGHLTHTHLPILLVGSLGESCAEFTRGRQSKRLWGNAKTNNIKNLRIATDGSIWFAQMCVCVCLYVCKPVVCSQTRTLAQTLSKQHLCWTPSDDSVKNNHKLSLGNILHLSVWTVSISGTKCTEIDQPTSPGWNTRVFAELLKSNLGLFKSY